jgi:non-homologous end joining protein Ku
MIFRGFQHAKDQYVQLSKEELDSLAEANNNIDLKEFIPVTSVDPVYLRTPITSAQDRKKDCQKPQQTELTIRVYCS